MGVRPSSKLSAPPLIPPEWATHIAGRSPKFKIHRNRGEAMNAVLYILHCLPRGGVVYHAEDGAWVEVYSYTPDYTCALCGQVIDIVGSAVAVDHHVPREQLRPAHWRCKYPDGYRHPRAQQVVNTDFEG